MAANRTRTLVIVGVGCLIILTGVGGLLRLPAAAVGGCIGWIVVMVWSARNERASGARR